MKDWVIAIRSYNKPDTICTHTLRVLREGGIPDEKILVFVASENEKLRYQKSINNDKIQLIVGVLGLKEIGDFITDYFEEGQPYVMMDDDVSRIALVTKDRKRTMPDLNQLFSYAFQVCEKFGVSSWSVNEVTNPLFLSKLPFASVAPKFLYGWCSGFINDKKLRLTEGILDDTERTCYFVDKEHRIVHLNRVFCEHQLEMKTGGGIISLAKERPEYERGRNQKYLEAEERLYAKYSDILELVEERTKVTRLKLKNVSELREIFTEDFYKTMEDYSMDFVKSSSYVKKAKRKNLF